MRSIFFQVCSPGTAAHGAVAENLVAFGTLIKFCSVVEVVVGDALKEVGFSVSILVSCSCTFALPLLLLGACIESLTPSAVGADVIGVLLEACLSSSSDSSISGCSFNCEVTFCSVLSIIV